MSLSVGRQSKRRRLAASVGPFRPADLDSARSEWHANKAALVAAEKNVQAKQAAIATVDPELGAAEWHHLRATRDKELVDARTEAERLTASVEHRRLRCLSIVRAISGVPVREAQARMAERRQRMAELAAELAQFDRQQADDEAAVDELAEAARDAEQEFLPAEQQWARTERTRQAKAEAEFARRTRGMGIEPHQLAPDVRRLLREPRQPVAEHDASSYPDDAARAAGVTRVDLDGGPVRVG